MADFTITAEIIVVADEAMDGIEQTIAGMNDVGDESEKEGRKTEMSWARVGVAIGAMAGISDKAFTSIMKWSPLLQVAMLEMSLATFEMQMAIGDGLAVAIQEELVPRLEKLNDWFMQLDPRYQQATSLILGLTLVATALAAVIALVVAIGLPLILIIGAIILIIAAFYVAWSENMFGVRDITQQVIDYMTEYITQFKVDWSDEIAQITEAFSLFVETIDENRAFLAMIFGVMRDLFLNDMTFFIEIVLNTVQSVIAVFAGLMVFLSGFIEFWSGVWEMDADKVLKGIALMASGIAMIIIGLLNFVTGMLVNFLNWIIGKVNSLPGINLKKVDTDALDINYTPTFHEGGIAPETGLYMLKKGEPVSTPTQYAAMRNEVYGRSGGGGDTYNYTIQIGSVNNDRTIRKLAAEIEKINTRKTRRKQSY